MSFGRFDPFHDKPAPYPLHSVSDACAIAQAKDADRQIRDALQIIELASHNLDAVTRSDIKAGMARIRSAIKARMAEIEAGQIAKDMKPLHPGDVAF